MRSMVLRRSAGFTLLELMIVIALIATLLVAPVIWMLVRRHYGYPALARGRWREQPQPKG